MDFSGSNLSERLEHSAQLVVVSTLGQVLNEQVVELVSVVGSLTSWDVLLDLNLLVLQSAIVELLNCLLGLFLLVELNVSKSSAFSIQVEFHSAGLDLSLLGEEVVDLLLSDILVQTSDDEVSLLVKVLGSHEVQNEGLSFVHHVVHFTLTLLGFLLGVEGDISVVKRLSGLLVSHRSGTLHVVSLSLEEFVQVKVVVRLGNVGHVKTWEVSSLLVMSLLVLLSDQFVLLSGV